MRPDPLVVYVSGHGFGHASRVVEVINAIHRQSPHTAIVVRTAAERWLFDLTLTSPVEFHRVACDPGVVQIDSLRLDAAETIRRAAAFYDDFPARVSRETAFLGGVRARAVVADIPPLGLAAAASAGLPAIALGNFTWDWIYRAYEEELRGAPALLPAIERAYRTASLVIRLPMWGGFEAMGRAAIVDVPLVARRATRSRDATRTALGLPHDLRVVLLSFGGYGLPHLELDALDLPGYAVITTGECGIRRAAGSSGTPIRTLDERALYAAGFRYEDLVAASDVVVSKPGYGIIAECAANRTALLYTSRGRFAEYDVLVNALPRMVRSGFISQEDLFSGRWLPHLEALLAQCHPTPPATDGADVAAGVILGFAQ